MAGRAETDQKGDLRNSGPPMMDEDRPLAPGRPGTELASMAVAFEDFGTETGEVLLVPVPAGVAAGAEPGDQLPFRAAGPTPKRALRPGTGYRDLLVSRSG